MNKYMANRLKERFMANKKTNIQHPLQKENKDNTVRVNTETICEEKNTERRAINISNTNKTLSNNYPRSFTNIDIEYFENLASDIIASDEHVIFGLTGRQPYSTYEDALICASVVTKTDVKELYSVFQNNCYCNERSISALIKRKSILNIDNAMSDYIYKFQSYRMTQTEQGKDAYRETQPQPVMEATTPTRSVMGEGFVYPDVFTDTDVNRLNKLAKKIDTAQVILESDSTGRVSYTEYEKDLLLTAFERGFNIPETEALYNNCPYCVKRSHSAIGRQIWNFQQASKDTYKETMENTYKKAKDPEQGRYGQAEKPQINMSVVVPEITQPVVDDVNNTLDKHIKARCDMETLISVNPYSYDVMQDRKALYNLFYKKTRKIDSNEARMLYVTDIARFWGVSDESAQNLIDDMHSDGFPLVRNGQEIYLVETKQEGSNLSHFIIDDVPSYDIGGGIKCTSIGILSDTHYGAEDCSVDSIRDYYARAYHNYNVRCFLHGGDFFNGHNVFKGQEYENQYIGFDQQLEHVAEVHPYFGSEVRTYSILGNHDESYIKNAGANILNALHDKRQDVVPIGLYQGLVTINGFNINLHHAAGGCGRNNPWGKINNICAQKQAIVTKYGLDKLDLLVVGHYHRTEVMSSFKQYDVQTAIFGGSFQKSNPFSVRIGSIDTILGGYVADLYEMPDGTKRVNISMIEAKGKDGYCNKTVQTVLSSHLSSNSNKRTGVKSCF